MKKLFFKKIIYISLPALGETVLYTILALFDLSLLGKHLGSTAVSAAGISTEILMTFSNIFVSIGISVAITSFVARNIGAKSQKKAEEFASIGFIIGVCFALLLSTIYLCYSTEILHFAGATDSVLSLGVTYMEIAAIGQFFIMLCSLLSSILRGYGDTTTPFIGASITTLLNLIFDIFLLTSKNPTFCWSVENAAFAKITSQFLGFLFLLFYFANYSKVKIRVTSLFSFSTPALKDFFFLSFPNCLEEAAYSLSRLFSNFIIMHSGSVAYAANQIANTVESISFMPGVGLATAATTLVGLQIGEKNRKNAKLYAKVCVLLGICIMLFWSILFFTIPKFLVSFFVSEKETNVLLLSSACLKIGALEQPFLAISFILCGALKGSGNTKTPLWISVVSSFGIRLPLLYYFIYKLHSSITIVWWITLLQWSFDSFLTYTFFNKKV